MCTRTMYVPDVARFGFHVPVTRRAVSAGRALPANQVCAPRPAASWWKLITEIGMPSAVAPNASSNVPPLVQSTPEQKMFVAGLGISSTTIDPAGRPFPHAGRHGLSPAGSGVVAPSRCGDRAHSRAQSTRICTGSCHQQW
ncbi:hypothetical protein ACFQV2_33885 [Actinokineospora soli]|uniref:Uncharacterized protein n=1 Tax=Actinokineospora soli TaxID=1048753 RepID=A0ABW2TYZ2_9PSEU